jgi:hypothetical protein
MAVSVMRARLLELGLVTLGAIAAVTETLSVFSVLSFWPVAVAWAGIAAYWVWRLRDMPWHGEEDWVVQTCLAICVGLWTLEGIAALVSAPNPADSMAYHMPRVVYWMQQRSVENFATEYLNQIMLQPLMEYVVLHFQILTGGDRLANVVAWLATGGYVMGASLVAGKLGANLRGQAVTAVVAATIPNGVLQASGNKNEALLGCLLLASLYYALEKKAWALGLAVGLACLTKGTAYLFAGPIVALFAPRLIPAAVLGVLIVNGPFYTRNLELSGSPLGFDSAQADGKYVWRNEPLGWKALASNLIRHATDQVGDRNERWNHWVYGKGIGWHQKLGLDPADKGTTWPYTKYERPVNTNHEADRNNRYHLALALLAGLYLLAKRDAGGLKVLLAVALGVVALAAYLKWQPFMGRMFLPLYAVASVAIGLWLARWPGLLQITLLLFLTEHVRLAAIQNVTRPLRGERSLFLESREATYFNDMTPWKVNDVYWKAYEEVRRSGCKTVAMDISYFQLEYPMQALLLEQDAGYRFVHVNTKNPSRKYERKWKGLEPCALVCLACDRWVEVYAGAGLTK